MLLLPTALGKKGGFYKSYYEKNKYELLPEDEKYLPAIEMEAGSHIIMWAWVTFAALIAGAGDVQILCILEQGPVLLLLFYFFRVNEKVYGIIGIPFLLLLGYFGFSPTPTLPSVSWGPASILLALLLIMIVPLAISMLVGRAEKFYESQPLTKELINGKWERELLIGTTLVGLVAGHITAIITNCAQNYVLLCAPCFIVTGGTHLLSVGDKDNANNSFVVGIIFVGFGLFPRVLY
jgi:hypothetical protein